MILSRGHQSTPRSSHRDTPSAGLRWLKPRECVPGGACRVRLRVRDRACCEDQGEMAEGLREELPTCARGPRRTLRPGGRPSMTRYSSSSSAGRWRRSPASNRRFVLPWRRAWRLRHLRSPCTGRGRLALLQAAVGERRALRPHVAPPSAPARRWERQSDGLAGSRGSGHRPAVSYEAESDAAYDDVLRLQGILGVINEIGHRSVTSARSRGRRAWPREPSSAH
jgi:hypothetical protein